MQPKVTTIALLVILAALVLGHEAECGTPPDPAASLLLLPDSAVFERKEVPQGAIEFMAVVRNEGAATITVAHPSICVPPGYDSEEIRYFADSHGKSEILLKVTKPDGAEVILRDSYLHHFDPGNSPFLTIPPHGTAAFQVGWFFPNARGRWEQDDVAAKIFLAEGEYKVGITFRNAYPKAALYDESARGMKFIDVWSGEMESPEITIEVR